MLQLSLGYLRTVGIEGSGPVGADPVQASDMPIYSGHCYAPMGLPEVVLRFLVRTCLVAGSALRSRAGTSPRLRPHAERVAPDDSWRPTCPTGTSSRFGPPRPEGPPDIGSETVGRVPRDPRPWTASGSPRLRSRPTDPTGGCPQVCPLLRVVLTASRLARSEGRVPCAQCQGIQDQFGERMARRELRRYRKRGPTGTTRTLLDALADEGVRGSSFLDVGGGVGVIQHELMEAGAASGTAVDASPAYVEAARAESERRGFADRVSHVLGDVVESAPDLTEADFVTLDRVVCCYPDMATLVDVSAARANRVLGLVYPRAHKRHVRIGLAAINLVQRLRRHAFRVFAHPTEAVDARVRSFGFTPRFRATTFVWQVVVYTKSPGAPVR